MGTKKKINFLDTKVGDQKTFFYHSEARQGGHYFILCINTISPKDINTDKDQERVKKETISVAIGKKELVTSLTEKYPLTIILLDKYSPCSASNNLR